MKENDYRKGIEYAWTDILRLALSHCGLDTNDPQALAVRLEIERREAIATLRTICRDHGDNDWPDDLHLSDIINKHIAWHWMLDK